MNNIEEPSRRKRNLDHSDDFNYANNYELITLLVKDERALNSNDKSFILDCYKEYGREVIEKIVVENQITPFAAHIFCYLDCDKGYWQSIHNKFVIKNEGIKSLIDEVFLGFKNHNCSSITLTENFAVVLSSDSCIGCFCSGDVDLSADIAELEQIKECLNSMGFFSKDQPKSIGEYSGQSMQFYNDTALGSGFWINVIWKPVTRAFLVQDEYEKRLKEDRKNAILIPNTNIRVLDDNSLMYFCALHISAGHYFTMTPGIRLHIDIDRLARRKNIDWKKLAIWEREDNAGVRISTTLYLSSKILNSPIPEESFSRSFKNIRNRLLVKYLINEKTNKIQQKSSLIRRLYIELASDDRNLLINAIYRFLNLLSEKFK